MWRYLIHHLVVRTILSEILAMFENNQVMLLTICRGLPNVHEGTGDGLAVIAVGHTSIEIRYFTILWCIKGDGTGKVSQWWIAPERTQDSC